MNEYAVWAGPVIALAALIYTVVASRSKKHGEQIGDIQRSIATVETQLAMLKREADQRVDRLEDRVTKTEAEIAHLPNKDATHHLELTMAEMRGELRTLAERIKPIAAISDRIQEAMVEKVTHG